MDVAKRIARVLGPVFVVLSITEGANLSAFAGNPAPVVYLNGTLLFAGGVAILQAHARWRPWSSALVTLMGWGMVAAGAFRMGWPAAAQAMPGAPTYGLLAVLLAIGVTMSWQGYRRGAR